jgi:iron complex outermembrane receptor protein
MIRGKLKFELSPALSVTLLYSHLRIDDTRTNVFSPVENVSRFYATRPAGETRATKPGVYAYDPENIAKSEQDEFGAKVTLDTGIGSLLSTTGYTDTTVRNRFDFDGSYIPASYITLDPVKTYTFQQALDYNIDSIDRVSLLVGASYFDIVNKSEQFNYSGRNLNASGTTPQTLADDYNVASNSVFRHHKKAWAAYADATWQFSDAWFLTIGGRYSSEELSAFGQAFSASPASVRRATNAKTTFKKFTPRAALRYEISPRTSIYATYSQGFRSGTYNTTLPACVNTTPACFVPAKQETVKAYEAGFKTAARGLRFDVAGFYYDYRNIQISATKEVAGVVLIDLGNAPKAKIYGAEANVSYELFNNFKVNAGGTWLHARYGDGFIYSAVGVSGAAPGINVNQDPLKTYSNVDQFQDLSGLQMTRAPNFSGNIGVTFDVPKGEGGLQFASNLKYSSRFVPSNPSVWGIGVGVPVDRQREQRFVQGAYAQINASITWTEPSGRYYARIWGNNLTDYQYKLHYNGNSSFGTYIPLSDPLTFGLTLGAKI